MDIKCIALDLDRTTLNAQGKLSKANEEAIRKAVAKGIHVCIASGRAFDTLPQDVVSIPGIEYAITSNGAAVYRIQDKQCLRSYVLTEQSVKKILELTKDFPVTYEGFIRGTAYAAKEYGCKAVIVMPTTTPLIKVNRTKGYGAEVVLYGDVYDEACAYALELAEKEGYTFIHPFDDPAVATGQGTIAMEIIKELPLVDYILVPIGGGGLATGVSTLAKMLNPNIRVIGVEPAGAACMKASLQAGEVVTLPNVNTIADGTAVKTPGKNVFPYLQKNLDDIITIEDDDLIVAFLDMVENHKMIVENSGLLTVAALKYLDVKDKKVVSILSGGNMDVITMSSVVQLGLIQRDRIFTVSVLLPDKAGELVRVATVIANEQGNVIKLDHNQFVSTNRNAAVELKITLEAFGTDHKERIVNALKEHGYNPKVIRPNL